MVGVIIDSKVMKCVMVSVMCVFGDESIVMLMMVVFVFSEDFGLVVVESVGCDVFFWCFEC